MSGHDGGVGEAGIGLLAHGRCRSAGGDLVAGEGADHAGGDLGVGHGREGRDLGRRNLRPVLGHIEAAVGREAAQHGVDEAHVRRLPAGGDVAHQPLIRLEDRRAIDAGQRASKAEPGERVLQVAVGDVDRQGRGRPAR